MVDLNEMVIFAKVVEAGSFTGAARALGLPKSTVSRKVAQLEERLGVRLLHRTTRSIRLTELGATYHERVVRIVLEAEEAEQAIAEHQNLPCGILRLSLPVEIGVSQFGRLVTEFLARYPQIEIRMDVSDRFVDLIEEGIDLALRAGQLRDSTLVARRLGSGQRIVCASPDYLAQYGHPETPQQLKGHECIIYGEGEGRKTLRFTGPTGIASVTLAGRFSVNSMSVVREAACAGLGIAIIPRPICRVELERGRLTPLLEQWHLPDDGIYAVYPSPRHLTPKVRAFIDFISERLEF